MVVRSGAVVSTVESSRTRELVLLGSVFAVAVAGLIYELVAGTLSTYLLGGSVVVFSLVIGLFLFAMVMGAFAAQWIHGQLERRFVEAELARIGGHDERANTLFERAIEGARRGGWSLDLALAHELAGRCRTDAANGHRDRAREAYDAWGAKAKVWMLERGLDSVS